MLSTVIVGGGPGGLGPLIAAAQQGRLPDWLDGGVAVVDRQDHLGGTLWRYGINSDSLGGSYLECLASPALPDPVLRVRDDRSAAAIARFRDGFPPLPLVDHYMRRLGKAIGEMIAQHGRSRFLANTEATAICTQADGTVIVEVRDRNGRRGALAARSAIVALGGRQDWAGQQLRPDLSLGDIRLPHLVPSDHLLSQAGLAEASAILRAAGRRRIVILGGSHSAYSVAWALLQLPGAEGLRPGQIAILQRRPPPVFYPDRAAAEADHYAVAPDDICPRTQRINRFGGLRGNGRDVWRQVAKRPTAVPEPRVVARALERFDATALRSLLKDAALVVVAFGYQAATLPTFDARGQRMILGADAGLPSVDERCRVVLADGTPLPNVFGIGLGSGYKPTPTMGGEPSFRGQANSLWLYQHDIGAVIRQEIERLDREPAPAAQPALKPAFA